MDIPSSTLNIVFLKHEVNTTACIACLSEDRVLSTLNDKADLFLLLMGQHSNVLNAESLHVCWECMAFLRKMRKFQFQVQYAHLALQQLLLEQQLSPKTPTNKKTLSKLCVTKLENFDITDTLEDKSRNKIEAGDITKVPNIIEIPVANNFTELMGDEILIKEMKEEIDLDYENNIADNDNSQQSDHDLVIDIKTEEKTETPKRNKKNKLPTYIKFSKTAKRTINPEVDLNNLELCFKKIQMTDYEIENIGKFKKNKKKEKSFLYCEDCRKEFEATIDIRRHKTFSHILKSKAPGPFKCLECKALCPDQPSLREHWAEHNTISRCKICDEQITCKSYMKLHAEMHAYFWTCLVCKDLKVVYRSYKDFAYHYRTIHRRSICDYCGQRSKSKKALLNHIRLKHLPPICVTCNKEFKNNHYLRRHNYQFHPEVLDKVVKPELTYCVECNKQFPSEARYRLHLSTTVAHNPLITSRKTIVPCPECGKQFARKIYMTNHYKLFHKKETKHYCALCDKYLVSAWSMKKHNEGVHQKIRIPKTKVCDTCGRAFGTNAVLEKHRRTHTGERPYKCPRCPAAFTQSSALHSHTRTQHKAV